MGEKLDKMKGRVKEAGGAATDNDEMRREGKLDQFSGDVKGKADDMSDKVKDVTENVRDKFSKDH